MDDLIVSNSAAGAGNPTRTNLDDASITGLELEGSYEADRLFGSLAVTIQTGDDISDPGSINPALEDRIPADTITLLLGTRLPTRNLELGWEGTYYFEKTRAQAGFGGAPPTNITADSNLIHDVFATWTPDQGVLRGTEFRVGVTNLLDTDYRTHLQSEAVRRSGRSINISLRRTF